MNFIIPCIVIFFTAFIVSLILIPFIIHYSDKKGLYDYIDERKIHNGNISRLGGLAIFSGFFCSFIYLLVVDFKVQFNVPIFVSALLLAFATGFIDDIKKIPARYKLLMQFACGLLVAFSGLQLDKITLSSGFTIHFGVFSYVLTMLWVATLMNAINMLDGMDGLASGIVLIASIFLAIIGYLQGMMVVVFLSLALAGGILGFLIFNFPPAKIFMGDGGAYFLGFIYSIMPLIGIKKASTLTVFFIPLILLLVPLMDMLHVMKDRFKGGYHIFVADRNHIHHRLMDIGFSTRGILWVLYSYTVILGFFSIILLYLKPFESLSVMFLLFFLTVLSFYTISVAQQRICNASQNTKKRKINIRSVYTEINNNKKKNSNISLKKSS